MPRHMLWLQILGRRPLTDYLFLSVSKCKRPSKFFVTCETDLFFIFFIYYFSRHFTLSSILISFVLGNFFKPDHFEQQTKSAFLIREYALGFQNNQCNCARN